MTAILGFAAFSGTGKTTLLVRLIPLLANRGIRTALIKHAHHDFDIDIPGKDSYELRKAGARQVLVASSQRRALITETAGMDDPDLGTLVDSLDHDSIDLVLVEGFRHMPFPKIELYRAGPGKPLLFPEDASIIAVAADHSLNTGDLPFLDINDPEAIAAFIQAWLKTAAGP